MCLWCLHEIIVLILIQFFMFTLSLFGLICNMISLDFKGWLLWGTAGEPEYAENWFLWSAVRKKFYYQAEKCFLIWLYWLVFNLKCAPQSACFSWLAVLLKESSRFIWDVRLVFFTTHISKGLIYYLSCFFEWICNALLRESV